MELRKMVLKCFNSMDKKIVKIMVYGMKISFVILLVSIYILAIYIHSGVPVAFYMGKGLFETGLFYVTACVIMAICFNKIKDDLS